MTKKNRPKNTSFHKISAGMFLGSFGIFISKISGLIRDIVYANAWGTGNGLGAFLVAFTIPNLFRRFLGEGALSESFIPIFNETILKKGKKEAFLLANNVLTVMGILLVLLVSGGMVACQIWINYFADTTFEKEMLLLTKYLLPFAFFICIAGILSGILNTLSYFAFPALSSSILNILVILAVVFICPFGDFSSIQQLYILAGAVLVSGILQVLILLFPLYKNGFFFFFFQVPNPQIFGV